MAKVPRPANGEEEMAARKAATRQARSSSFVVDGPELADRQGTASVQNVRMVRNRPITSQLFSPSWFAALSIERVPQRSARPIDAQPLFCARSAQREDSYASRRDEGMRPRSLTSYPLLRAHALMACV